MPGHNKIPHEAKELVEEVHELSHVAKKLQREMDKGHHHHGSRQAANEGLQTSGDGYIFILPHLRRD